MATSLEKSKKLNGVIKPFHLYTNPEILMKIGPLASEPAGLRGRPLKNKKIKKKTSVKYIALPATLPSRLNYRKQNIIAAGQAPELNYLITSIK